MGLFSGPAKIIGGIAGDVAEGAGATSTFVPNEIDINEGAFVDPNSGINKKNLRDLAAEAAARTAPTAAGTTVGPTAAIQGPQIAPVGAVAPTTLDPAAQVNAPQEFRAGQAGLTAALQADIAGTGPQTAAQIQLRRGSEDIINTQRALAASSGPGADAGAVARNTARNVASQGQVVNEQAAALRAGELSESKQLLSETLTNARGADIQTAVAQAGFDQERLVAQGKITAEEALANLEAEKQLAISQGNMDLAAALQNQQTVLQTNLAQAQLTQETELANQQAELETQRQKDELVAFYTSQGLSLDEANRQALIELERLRVNQRVGVETLRQQTESQNAATRGQIAGGIIAGGAAAGAAVIGLSDIRAKMNIVDGDPAVHSMLEKLKPYEFEYKNPDAPGATHGKVVGVMAQDLLKSDLGKSVVITETGPLKMDLVKAVSLALASGADAHKRLKRLEQIPT